MSSEITNQDADLLSAYLDNALDADERAALEARLTQEEFLRRELEALRRTIELVNTLPTLKAPRNFTLTPAILAPRPEALPAVLAQPAVFAAAPQAASTQPRVLSRPRPRRMLWQPFAAAAAVVVLAFGFFSVSTFTASMPASAPNEVASMSTATLSFSNVVVETGADTSITADNLFGEAQDTEAVSTAAKVGTAAAEIQPVAPNAPAQLTVVAQQIPTTQDAQQMLTQSQFSQGGMGGGGDDSQLNDAPVFSANESINSDPSLHGFTVATVIPMQEIMGQTTAQSAVLAPAATPAPADIMNMSAPPTMLDEQVATANTLLPAATGGITTLVYEPPVIEAEQSQWLRVILALLNPFVGRFLPLP